MDKPPPMGGGGECALESQGETQKSQGGGPQSRQGGRRPLVLQKTPATAGKRLSFNCHVGEKERMEREISKCGTPHGGQKKRCAHRRQKKPRGKKRGASKERRRGGMPKKPPPPQNARDRKKISIKLMKVSGGKVAQNGGEGADPTDEAATTVFKKKSLSKDSGTACWFTNRGKQRGRKKRGGNGKGVSGRGGEGKKKTQ